MFFEVKGNVWLGGRLVHHRAPWPASKLAHEDVPNHEYQWAADLLVCPFMGTRGPRMSRAGRVPPTKGADPTINSAIVERGQSTSSDGFG